MRGAIGGVFGVLAGVAGGFAVAAGVGVSSAGLAVDGVGLMVAAVGAVAVTVAAASVPSATAMRVAPLAALRPADSDAAAAVRQSRVRMVIAVLLAGPGIAALACGASSAAITGAGESLVLDVPWLQLAAVLVAAVVAGLLASVLPARRAARTAPVVALVDVG